MKKRLNYLFASCLLPVLAIGQDNAPFVPPDPTYGMGQTVTIEGQELSVTYLDFGDGPAVIPFMFTGGGYVYWQSFIEAAKANYRVLAPDESSQTPAHLQALIEHTESGPVDLLTHSASAWLAIHFAAQHPELVNSLILLEPAYAPDLDSARRSASTLQASCSLSDQPPEVLTVCELINSMTGPGYFERLPEFFLSTMNPTGDRSPADAGLPMAGAELRAQGWMFPVAPICDVSASLTVPVLFIRGSVSTESNSIGLDAHESCLPPHESVVIQDATHFAHLERPAEFNAAVLEFVERQRTLP